jgi:hypothetical protein
LKQPGKGLNPLPGVLLKTLLLSNYDSPFTISPC